MVGESKRITGCERRTYSRKSLADFSCSLKPVTFDHAEIKQRKCCRREMKTDAYRGISRLNSALRTKITFDRNIEA